jgi:hypothetical protein
MSFQPRSASPSAAGAADLRAHDEPTLAAKGVVPKLFPLSARFAEKDQPRVSFRENG